VAYYLRATLYVSVVVAVVMTVVCQIPRNISAAAKFCNCCSITTAPLKLRPYGAIQVCL